MFLFINDPDVQKYLSPRNKKDRQQLENLLIKINRNWSERGFSIWCVVDKISDQMLGYCGFQYFDKTENIEIIFGILKENWRKGLATEAAKASVKYGFENLGFNKIYAATDPENIASRFVIEKIRLRYDEKNTHYDMNLLVYSICTEDFRSFEFY